MRTLSMEEVSLVSGAGEGCDEDSGSGGNDQEQRSTGENLWTAFWTGVGGYLGGTAGSAAGPGGGAAGAGFGSAAGYYFGDSTIGPAEPLDPPTGGNCPNCHDGGP